MWGNLAAITFFIGFVAPPFWILTILFMWLEYVGDKRKDADTAAKAKTPPMADSHPGECPHCGDMNWTRSALRTMPAIGILSHSMHEKGNAAVAEFTCLSCGSHGRYARSYVRPQDGWIAMTRWTGGW